MIYNQATKLNNNDEVILKKFFNGTEEVLSVCGTPKEVQENGKIVLIFDLLSANGELLKDVPHIYIK